MALPRVAVLFDLEAENWPSMALVGEMLVDNLRRHHSDAFDVEAIRAEAAGWHPVRSRRLTAAMPRKATLFMGRFWTYPRLLRRIRNDFDVFHVIDHSYSHLVHELPAARTVVTCHDVDTFRCLLDAPERRGAIFRFMTRRILQGMQKAARVTCDTAATRSDLLANNLVPGGRLVVVPNGVHPSCLSSFDKAADAEAERWLGTDGPHKTYVLHVGVRCPANASTSCFEFLPKCRLDFRRQD